MSDSLAKTPLHEWHSAHNGRMVDFAGWSMPVQYGSILGEHQAAREGVGLFDVSHMGRLRFSGKGVPAFLDSLVTRRVDNLKSGAIRYALVCNEQGGILDDVLVYNLTNGDVEPVFAMVVNASNRAKIVAWIEQQLDTVDDVVMIDDTEISAMIAVQGPRALEVVQPLVSIDVSALKYYTGDFAQIGTLPGFVSRTGYTGEDGCELVFPGDGAEDVWEKLLASDLCDNIQAVGLGARDTLRIEAAMPLYGHELSEEIDPLSAGLGFAVNLVKSKKDATPREFIGSQALGEIQAGGLSKVRVGLELPGRRAPRENYAVFNDSEEVGIVTSGVFSPTLEKAIGMAYVAPEFASIGQELSVDLRGKQVSASVVDLPFYQKS